MIYVYIISGILLGCSNMAEEPKQDFFNHDFTGRYYGETRTDSLTYVLDVYMDSNAKTGSITGDAVYLVIKRNGKLLYGDHADISTGRVWERTKLTLRLQSRFTDNKYTFSGKVLRDSTTITGTLYKNPEYWQVDVDFVIRKIQ